MDLKEHPHLHTSIHKHKCTPLHTRTQAHTHICAYIYTYICTYTHTGESPSEDPDFNTTTDINLAKKPGHVDAGYATATAATTDSSHATPTGSVGLGIVFRDVGPDAGVRIRYV
jgi:hypothetical protein